MIVLANDGISQVGVEKLENNGFKVITTNVAQDQIIDYINKNSITCLLVRSATKVRKDIIDSCESLKLIGRGGVGMDNIDVEYAKSKGIRVINTPGASSLSVAELVFAHIMTCSRFLHDSNRNMPLEGDVNFKKLKKNYSKKIGFEGGQMPLQRRVPKFGFNNRNRKEYTGVNLGKLQELVDKGAVKNEVTLQTLMDNGLAHKNDLVKILGDGELKASLKVSVHKFTASAKAAIESAGGEAISL